MPDELARLFTEEKEEDAEEGARKIKEDRGDVDGEAGRFFMVALKVTLRFSV